MGDAQVGAAAPSARDDTPRPIRAWTWALGCAGGALLAIAAVDLLRGTGDDAVLALVFVGFALVLGPVLLPRVHRFSAGVSGFSFELSREIAALDAPRTAELVDRWGAGLTEAATGYAAAHTVLRGHEYTAARVRLQDHFVNSAAASALVQRYDRREVQRLFEDGPPVVRVLALGLMLGDPSLADAATIESAITGSRSANEQYHGLRLAEVVGPRLTPDERRRLVHAITTDPMIGTGGDRSVLRDRVLALLAEADDAHVDGGHGPRESPGQASSIA